ncbi:magnesium and cobalt transport protein CorA [Allostreptomyces psammosilenae]|uniref:Magnesium transporter n=1 Tax=Allostreptomyces psammosilenae TaxID=1892865 RepID=A0A852ZRQ1_9ACTN|nr:magnesium and cobalt transport protein CorA [Allostreptomyces psammosilenae]NYI03960.1 magnesium transporter [Allostreptomyces psammosilenae]
MIVDFGFYRDGRRVADGPTDPARLAEALAGTPRDGDTFAWIGLFEPGEEEFASVAREFDLHPLAVEDALHAHQRPKLERYGDTLFLALKPVQHDDEGASLRAGDVFVFVGAGFVVTVRHGPTSPLGEVRQALQERRRVLAHGPAAVMYAVCDAVVDQYLEVAEALRLDLEDVEIAAVPAPSSRGASRGGGAAERVYAFRRELVGFRRATVPLLAPLQRLSEVPMPNVPERSRPFFRDVSDHLMRVNDQVEAMDRLLSNILDATLAQVSVRQNDDMRRISAWAAIVAVPTALAGIWGMNFEHMPELRQGWGYPAALAMIALVSVVLYRIFRRSGWL